MSRPLRGRLTSCLASRANIALDEAVDGIVCAVRKEVTLVNPLSHYVIPFNFHEYH